MNTAYNSLWLYNMAVVNETKRWYKRHFISEQQFENIKSVYPFSVYNPSVIIRILLFLAACVTLASIIGIAVLITGISNDEVLSIGSVFFGVVFLFVLEMFFIKTHHHFKSGVTEALLYFGIGFSFGGFIALTDGNEHLCFIVGFIVFTLAAIRYLDLISTLLSIGFFCCFLFYELYAFEGIFRSTIQFVFTLTFIPVYVVAKRLKARKEFLLWEKNLMVVESISLLLIYGSGNYFVVRELSEKMMNLYMADGEDIPFAFIFYILTAITPIVYLYIGIKTKDKILVRIGLLLIALSAFTFKYYFSFGHPEVTLTIAGAAVLVITLLLLNYLRVFRNGYTRENLLSEKWADMNIEAFIISHTVGDSPVAASNHVEGGGGEFGGGGSTDSF